MSRLRPIAPDSIDPDRAALLVMDFEEVVLAGLPDTAELLARAAEAIAVARRRGLTVAYVRLAFENDEFGQVRSWTRMAATIAQAGWEVWRDDSPSTAVHGLLAPKDGDIVVRKTRTGAFSTTGLDNQLRSRGVDTLVLAGIHTSGVVLSTVRDAADRDYRLFVLGDACADPAADVGRFLLQKILSTQARIIDVGLLESLLPT